MPDDKFQFDTEFLKYDEELGLAFGFAIVCKVDGEDYYDLGGIASPDESHHVPEDVMLKLAADFMSGARIHDDTHDYEDHGKVIFAFPLTTEIAKSFGIETKVTGLLVAVKPDAATLEKFRKGELRGFSIGGLGRFEEAA